MTTVCKCAGRQKGKCVDRNREEIDRKSLNSSSEYGEPVEYDPNFNGPVHNRTCTDMFCCVLFMAAIIGYMIVGILAWLYGDPRHVLYPRNSTGMFCGVGPNKGKPNLFYFDLQKCATTTNKMAAALHGLQCPTTQVCVEKCPSVFWILPTQAFQSGVKAVDHFQQQYCIPSFNLSKTNLTVQEIVGKEFCPSFYIPTSSVLGRCLPSAVSLNDIPRTFVLPGLTSVNDTVSALKNAISDVLSGFNAKHIEVKIFEDFATSWYWILIGLLAAMLLSIIFLLLLRFVAPILVWVLILGVLAVIAYGIWHCHWEYNYKDPTMTIGNLKFSSHVSAFLKVRETWLAFMIILCIVGSILLLIVFFMRTRIVLATSLFQEASKALKHMLSTLLYPLVTFMLLAVCISYWGITALYLATSGAPIYKVVALSSTTDCAKINGTVNCNPLSFDPSAYATCPTARCIFIRYNEEGPFQQNLFNLQIYNGLGFLWCVNFVIALGQCTLAGAFASYYWAFSKPADIPTFPLSQAFIRSLRYHVGSLAFGALILTVCQMCRFVLEYLHSKFGDGKNPFTHFIKCCLKCCFWVLEKFIKFMNRNTYIMIAIYGKNFCVSAKNAFSLLRRNIVRVVILDKVTDLLLLFCKILVVAAVGVLAFFFFSGRILLPGNTFQHETLNYYWVPIITVIVGSYFIAQGFFSVYSMCVDTLFLCFLEDLERNDGSIQKPYYMSKSLLRIFLKMNDNPRRGT